MKSVFVLLFLLIGTVSFPQKYQFENKIGQFVNASSFYINSAGFIYVSDINTDEITAIDTSGNILMKIDICGNFLQNFGGYDYGNYALQKPVQLAVSMQNNIFVIDGNQIIMFDHYGNGNGKITGTEDFTSIRIIFEWLTVTS